MNNSKSQRFKNATGRSMQTTFTIDELKAAFHYHQTDILHWRELYLFLEDTTTGKIVMNQFNASEEHPDVTKSFKEAVRGSIFYWAHINDATISHGNQVKCSHVNCCGTTNFNHHFERVGKGLWKNIDVKTKAQSELFNDELTAIGKLLAEATQKLNSLTT